MSGSTKKQEKIKKRFELIHKSGVLPWKLHDPRPELNEFLSQVKSEIGDKAKLLDVGCGDGWISLKAAGLGLRTWGIDASPTAIENAQEQAQGAGLSKLANFQVGDALDLPYEDNFFDAAVDRGLFHHILPANRDQYFLNLTRVLKSDALMYLSVFSRENPYGIGQRFSRKELENLLEDKFTILSFSQDETQLPANLYHMLLRKI